MNYILTTLTKWRHHFEKEIPWKHKRKLLRRHSSENHRHNSWYLITMIFTMYLFQNKKLKGTLAYYRFKERCSPELFLKVICGKDKTTKLMENRKPPSREKNVVCVADINK